MAVETEILVERTGPRFEGMKISWGGVFGGVLAGIGTLMLLTSLGIAIGISATDPQNTDADVIGTGAAIWTALTLLVSLFVAGWASTRLSMLWERTTAMFEGVLVWVLSLIIILYLTASGVSLVASGAFNIAGRTAQTIGIPEETRAQVQRGVENLGAQTKQSLTQKAQDVKPQATTTAWITFGALVLSLLAAILGAAAGRRGVVRRAERPSMR